MVIDTVVVEIYNGFILSRDLTISGNQKVMLLFGKEPLKISHHPAYSGSHSHCGGGDIIF